MAKPGRSLVLALLVLVALLSPLSLECATPTALTVTVYSEVPCSTGSAVAVVGGLSLSDLPQKAPSSSSTQCGADGLMGNVVVVPAGAKNETVAFAVMQRADGQPADNCLDPAQASGCIVAKRQLRFETHDESDMRVDLRLSCLGVLCATDQTCVKGSCVVAQTSCGSSCDESTLAPNASGIPDAGRPDQASPDANDASLDSELLALTVSAGTLSPAFSKATLGYGVLPSVVSLGVPFTVTPTYVGGGSVTINGAPVKSGASSPAIPLGLVLPTTIDVAFTKPAGAPTHYAIVVPPVQEAYAKASNNRAGSQFGWVVAISGDTLAVGAPGESSNATGVNGNQSDVSATSAGAVFVFTRSGTTWSQQAYLKASNARQTGLFGYALALSGDTLAVGAWGDSSNAVGINGNQADTSVPGAGAVYVFTRSGVTWSQQAYVKASNPRAQAAFGYAVALSGDTMAVGSVEESSNATGIDGNQADMSFSSAGAAYVFTRLGIAWSQQAYIKASNTRTNATFGVSVALSGDILAVGSTGETSNATGIGGNQADTSLSGAGAAYVFTRLGTSWSQQAYIKASNTRANADFGSSVVLSGTTLAVSADNESSGATGINGSQADTSANNAGAIYVFTRSGETWSQEAYVKPSNTKTAFAFGSSVALFGDTLAVGSPSEPSKAIGINGDESDTSTTSAGAVYVYTRIGSTWSQHAYVKASNNRMGTLFGCSASLSADTLVVGAWLESSNAFGINGSEADTSLVTAGAAYVLK